MNYKKIIGSQQLRFFILRLLFWIPDRIMLKIQYRIKEGRALNLKNPQRFTEKIQWYKMYYRNPLMPICVDKHEVRKYLESKGVGHILNDLYGIYNCPDEIDFNTLPNQFVIKTTDGGGGDNILICEDKTKLNKADALRKLSSWKNKKNIDAGREWAYTQMSSSRIIIERYLKNTEEPETGLYDYKFFCFHSRVFCVQVDTDRNENHQQNYYDRNWKCLNIHCSYPLGKAIPMPAGFQKMIEIAETLSSDFPFVRVDLYWVNRKIIFGELTFYPSSGYGSFVPDAFDYELGKQFLIS